MFLAGGSGTALLIIAVTELTTKQNTDINIKLFERVPVCVLVCFFVWCGVCVRVCV